MSDLGAALEWLLVPILLVTLGLFLIARHYRRD